MSDLDAIIAQQKAAHAANEALPGRYDNVEVKDLARQVEMEAMGIAAWRANTAVETTPDPEARLRGVAAGNPRASAAFGLLNAGAPVIVALDEGGSPLTQPARDPDVLASWWEPGGPYADRWPAVPCGPQGGLFGLLCFPGEGADWFRKIATIHHPSRAERLMALADRVTEMGVPPSGGDDWDDEPPLQPDELRATVGARLWLVEDLPTHRAVNRAWSGSLRSAAGQAVMRSARQSPPRQLTGMVWSWPTGQTLPVGRELRKGVESLPAIPALGAELVVGGVRFVVRQTIPGLISPPPDWLIAALKELA